MENTRALLERFINWTATNPWIALAVLAATVISFVITILSVRWRYKDREKRLLAWFSASKSLIEASKVELDTVNVSYQFKDQSVSSLEETTVTIANAGNLVLKRSDFSTEEPLTIRFDDETKVLEATACVVGRPAAEVLCSEKGNCATVTFPETLKPKEYIEVMVHTENKKKEPSIVHPPINWHMIKDAPKAYKYKKMGKLSKETRVGIASGLTGGLIVLISVALQVRHVDRLLSVLLFLLSILFFVAIDLLMGWGVFSKKTLKKLKILLKRMKEKWDAIE